MSVSEQSVFLILSLAGSVEKESSHHGEKSSFHTDESSMSCPNSLHSSAVVDGSLVRSYCKAYNDKSEVRSLMENSRKPNISRRHFLSALGTFAASSPFLFWSPKALAGMVPFAFLKRRASGAGAVSVGNSLRFSAGNSTYLSRTPASTGNQKKWTFSAWVKQSRFGSQQPIFCAYSNPTNYGLFTFSANAFIDATDRIKFYTTIANNTQCAFISTGYYRDPSAWYHLVLAIDTAQPIDTDRVKIYVNGSQITSWATAAYPAQDADIGFYNSSSYSEQIGALASGSYGYFDGYMSEAYFVEGQALAPASFGQADATTGQWVPKQYTGSFGTNGFYLPFRDNAAVNGSGTASGSYPSVTGVAGLGADHSGNNNHFSGTGFQTYDQVLDSPTNNFCTFNPLVSAQGYPSTNNQIYGLANGNLRANGVAVTSSYVQFGAHGTWVLPSTGKWYWEVQSLVTPPGVCYYGVGIYSRTSSPTDYNVLANAGGYGVAVRGTSNSSQYRFNNGGYGTASVTFNETNTAGKTMGVCYDADAGTLSYIDGAGVFVSNFNTGIPAGSYAPVVCSADSGFNNPTAVVNFGQGGLSGLTYDAASGGRFKYTPPAGYKALCTANLPEPNIKLPKQYFDTVLYTGTGASAQDITGLSFQPDLVWAKARNTATHHMLTNSVVGAGTRLSCSQTSGEETTNAVSAFLSNGFSLPANVGGSINDASINYVAWSWKKGAIPGFDIVQGSGTSASAHALGVKPAMVIAKNRFAVNFWSVWHKSATTGTQRLALQSSGSISDVGPALISWDPTATHVYSGSSAAGEAWIAYCFAEITGFSKFGSYTGNGVADGPFVWCGFRPRFLLIKSSSNGGEWTMWDAARGAHNPIVAGIHAEQAAAENSFYSVDFLSNGFKIRDYYSTQNGPSYTFIFAAFAEAPFKYANAR